MLTLAVKWPLVVSDYGMISTKMRAEAPYGGALQQQIKIIHNTFSFFRLRDRLQCMAERQRAKILPLEIIPIQSNYL